MVVELLVELLVDCRLPSCRKLGYDPGLAEVDVLDVMSAEMRVSAVGVVAPHLVEVQSLASGRIFARPLAVLSVDVVHRVPRITA